MKLQKKKGHFSDFVAVSPKSDHFEAWFDFHFDDLFSSHCEANIIVLLVVYCWKKLYKVHCKEQNNKGREKQNKVTEIHFQEKVLSWQNNLYRQQNPFLFQILNQV